MLPFDIASSVWWLSQSILFHENSDWFADPDSAELIKIHSQIEFFDNVADVDIQQVLLVQLQIFNLSVYENHPENYNSLDVDEFYSFDVYKRERFDVAAAYR